MQIRLKLPSLLIIIAANFSLFGQADKRAEAQKKGQEAVRLMDEGKIEESIKLLKEARKLDPESHTYPYEMAYAYTLKRDYKGTIKIAKKLIKHKDASDRTFELLANAYDYAGKKKKALDIYQKGLERFPNSGSLYLNIGVYYLGQKEYNKALGSFEQGIYVDPNHPSNYYWASKLYCQATTEEVWGMIYGEIFINLEPGTRRTGEISKLLYDTYKNEITFSGDTSASVSFSQRLTINADDLLNKKEFKLPFSLMAYEPTLIMSIPIPCEINLSTLDTIRTNFVTKYFELEMDKKYPNILFEYQKKIKEAGHMQAYNYWLLLKGDEDAFKSWQEKNQDKWDDFVKWYKVNSLEISKKKKFHSGQY